MRNKFYFVLLLCLAFVVSCNKSGENGGGDTPDSNKKITYFVFDNQLNKLPSKLLGSIDEPTKTITIQTQQWITSPEALIATFDGAGTVTVNGVKQVSTITPNDFRKDITYTVTAEDKSTVTYTVLLKSPQTTGIPVVKIDVKDGKEITEKTEEYYTAAIQVIDDENPAFCFEKETGIRGRGNTTWYMPKKPYRLKFNNKTSLFGLGAEKSWVLLANYQDPTGIMNDVAFELARRLQLPFANHSRHVQLYMNNTYRGCYLITEQIQVNEHSVNINSKTGFLAELDVYYDEVWQFKSNTLGLPVMIKSPDITKESDMDFIKKAVHDLENAMFNDPKFPNNNYKDLIDVNSLINFLLVNEITRNQELNHPKSVYMYKKDSNSPIGFGPVWDFDWGFGYAEYGFMYYLKTNMLFFEGSNNGTQIGSRFFSRFFDDPEFRELYKKRWNEMKLTQIKTITDYVGSLGGKLQKAQAENYRKWSYGSLTFTDEINKMKNWLNARITFLDGKINSL